MFATNIDTRLEYAPGDPILIKNIVSQLKSQGVFDQFRKECISDVDTKPAYQNLCHRVDGRVEAYLSDTKWGPDLNKNQLRENIRKHVNECTFVDSGISRIVDQLVNPRINTVLVPKVEDIVYCYLGIERPENDKFQVNSSASATNVSADDRKNDSRETDLAVKLESDSTSSVYSQQTELTINKDISSDSKNGVKREPSLSFTTESTNLNPINACSDIDSDEDDMSPPFEPHEKSDIDMSAESDYSMDILYAKCDVKSESKLNTEGDKIFRNLERICGEESMDSVTSSCTDKMSSRKPSLSLELPNTPTINYETSDESQDYFKKSNLTNLRRESVQNESGAPDTSSMDSFAEKVPEDEQQSLSNTAESVSTVVKIKTTDEVNPNKLKKSETKSGDSKDSKRNHKHSEYKRDKEHKSDKHDSSKSDKDRKSSKDKDKDRSNHESKGRTSKEGHNRERKDHGKDGDKSKNHEKTSKHRELSKSSSDKSRSSSSRSKLDEKKKSSSSKHDSESVKERSKHRKEESSDAKKSKTQCNVDNKKTRTDRRSSDRDSAGPSSSSHSSSHRSSSKTDKEKHRHSSSSSTSSSHKTKKNVETKDNDRADDTLFDTIMSVMDSTQAPCDALPGTNVSNIENTSNLFDILNDNDESRTSRSAVSRKSSLSAESGEGRRKDDNAAKKKENKSVTLAGISSRKSSLPGNDTSSTSISDAEKKKPKIARNASDILRIMELRKEYKEKMEAEQRGKENTNSETKKDTSNDENDKKSILGERSADNCVFWKTDEINESFNECKLKIKRIDSHFRLVNGSCIVHQHTSEHLAANNNDVNVGDNNAGNTNEYANEEKHRKLNAQSQSQDVKVNGSLKDPASLTASILELGNCTCDTVEQKKPEHAGTKPCLLEKMDKVRYFEPAELNADFKNFVAKRIKESEEMYLENFSIHLKCPVRYDCIFRDQLGAIVKRKDCNSGTLSSPFKYNSELIDNKAGNEKGIMMRIKKSLPENETLTRPFSYPDGLQKEVVVDYVMSSNVSNNISCNKVASTKRKTLGIKRRSSHPSKRSSNSAAKVIKLNHTNNMNGVLENPCLSVPGYGTVDNGDTRVELRGSLNNNRISDTSTPDNQKSTGTSICSVHSSGPPPGPKIQKPISKEQKRKQFYYDANDLYKPRPSFLVSSRRSRGLNPDKA